MDKLKVAWTLIKKYHFWGICALLFILTPLCWWSASDSLAKQFENRRQELDSCFQKVATILNPANETVIERIKKQDADLKDEVYRAWEVLYKQQKEKNPLPAVLGPDFKKDFEAIPTTGKLSEPHRVHYREYLRSDHFPDLRAIGDIIRPVKKKDEAADAKQEEKTAEEKPAPAVYVPPIVDPEQDKARAGVNEMTGIVQWDETQYNAIRARYLWPERPSTLKVALAQEDLWVYEALLRIIKNTNQGATSNSNAAIRRILALDIGAGASQAWQTSGNLVFRGTVKQSENEVVAPEGPIVLSNQRAPGIPGAAPTPVAAPMGDAAAPGSTALWAADAQPDDAALMKDRYVDDAGRPVPTTDGPPYISKPPYEEFKMMPVRLDLEMDERKLPALLVQCANSSMPIEVRRVRIHKNTTGALPLDFSADDKEATAGETPAPTAKKTVRGPIAPKTGAKFAPKNAEIVDANYYYTPIEIQGIIYIYNRPDKNRLGKGSAAEPEEVPEAAPEEGAAAPGEAAEAKPATAEPPTEEPAPAAPAAPAQEDALKTETTKTPAPDGGSP